MDWSDDGLVVVAGGAGDVGVGVVLAFLKAGATVAVPSRSEQKLKALSDVSGSLQPRLRLFLADIGSAADARRLAQEISSCGRTAHVVAALGGWRGGQSLLDTSPEVWFDILSERLTTHFNAATALLPLLLEEGGSYTFIAGLSSERAIRGAGAGCVASAGQRMLKSVLSLELEASAARINEIVLGQVKTRARLSTAPDMITSEDVGHIAVAIAKANVRGKTFHLRTRIDAQRLLAELDASRRLGPVDGGSDPESCGCDEDEAEVS